jgi:uncharacterized protein (DUF2252 family)
VRLALIRPRTRSPASRLLIRRRRREIMRSARLDPAVAALSPAERAARGKAARAAVPRESQAAFEPGKHRPDPVSLLERQAAGRVPELLPIRYGRMLASPFSFLRGAALPMASDLATTPATGITVQLSGDAHLSNFGIYASPERRLVFDVNDFDETLPGPWEWDIKRLATSVEVAARVNDIGGKRRREIVQGTVTRYRESMRHFAGQHELDVWYAPAELEQLRARYQALVGKPERKLADEDLTRLQDRDGRQALDELVRVVNGEPRIVAHPPLLVPVADLPGPEVAGAAKPHLNGILADYRRTLLTDRRYLVSQFRAIDAARKVVGVGSVGTRCWIILLTGRDPSDRLFLQVKEADPSALSGFIGPSTFPSQGERVVAGQRIMQEASDIFLGWHRPRKDAADAEVGDSYVRQLRDWKFSLVVEAMGPRAMQVYGQLCGHALARSHARSGDRIAIAAYLGKSTVFDNAVADFAVAYADQTDRDLATLAAAVKSGKLVAERGV